VVAVNLAIVRNPVGVAVSITFIRKLVAVAVVAGKLTLVRNTVAVAVGTSTERNIADIGDLIVIAVWEGLADIWNAIVITVDQRLTVVGNTVPVAIDFTDVRESIMIAIGLALIRNAVPIAI
jgi:hypothetical protein